MSGIVNPSTNATDSNAVHVNVSSEISGITEKTAPVSNDLVIIEDSAASNAKKKLKVGNLPGSGASNTVTSAAQIYANKNFR